MYFNGSCCFDCVVVSRTYTEPSAVDSLPALPKLREIFEFHRVLRICGYEDSVGIPTGFSTGMAWVRGLNSNPVGSRAKYTEIASHSRGGN